MYGFHANVFLSTYLLYKRSNPVVAIAVKEDKILLKVMEKYCLNAIFFKICKQCPEGKRRKMMMSAPRCNIYPDKTNPTPRDASLCYE